MLSVAEATKKAYGFTDNNARQKKPTEYAMSQGVYKASNGCGWWWLRSPYYDDSDRALYIFNDGDFIIDYVNPASHGVLPALQISLSD